MGGWFIWCLRRGGPRGADGGGNGVNVLVRILLLLLGIGTQILPFCNIAFREAVGAPSVALGHLRIANKAVAFLAMSFRTGESRTVSTILVSVVKLSVCIEGRTSYNHFIIIIIIIIEIIKRCEGRQRRCHNFNG